MQPTERIRLEAGYDCDGLPYTKYVRETLQRPPTVMGPRLYHLTVPAKNFEEDFLFQRTRCGARIPIVNGYSALRGRDDYGMFRGVFCARCVAKDLRARKPKNPPGKGTSRRANIRHTKRQWAGLMLSSMGRIFGWSE
jgi:hypothetical protein